MMNTNTGEAVSTDGCTGEFAANMRTCDLTKWHQLQLDITLASSLPGRPLSSYRFLRTKFNAVLFYFDGAEVILLFILVFDYEYVKSVMILL
jgi:hypothetical protein